MNTKTAPLVIVISNFNTNNPYAEKRIPFTGTWNEAREAVLKLRAKNPKWYIGVKMPC